LALDSGRVTAVGLLEAYLDRMAVYDHAGIRLNAVVVMNPQARAEAAAADALRASRQTRGPLDGIPYTAKDSYCERGFTLRPVVRRSPNSPTLAPRTWM
jgi:amidase